MENNEKLKALLSKDYMPIIYKNIKKYRKESGMSLMEVAEILDMSHDYLRSILFDKKLDDFLKEEK